MSERSRLLRRIGSPRLAAILIAVLIALQLLSVLVPQRGYLGTAYETFAADSPALSRAIETLGLDTLFGGWPFALLCLLLAANITACTWVRFARWRHPAVPGSGSSRESVQLKGSAEDYLALVGTSLTAEGWSIAARSEKGLLARKGAAGFLGSMLLHVALLVIIAGGAATALTSFRGEMIIAEGQEVVDQRESYLTVSDEPAIGPAYTGSRIGLDGTDVTYDGSTIVSIVAHMHASDAAGRTRVAKVRVNHPFDIGTKSYLIKDGGYALAAVISIAGEEPVPVVINLGEKTDTGWADTIEVGGLEVELHATPDAASAQGHVPVQRFTIDDPRLRVRASIEGTAPVDVVLAPGESVQITSDAALAFEDVRLWNRYLVRGEPARWVTYVGFWLAVAGAVLRFSIPERRIAVVCTEDRVRVGVRTRPWAGRSASSDARTVERLIGLSGVQSALTDNQELEGERS